MTEVYNRRSSTIDHLQTPRQLAPESILGRMQACSEVALRHVLQQRLVAMASFKQCLPDVMVRVDEAGGDDLVCAVDDFVSRRWSNVCCYH